MTAVMAAVICVLGPLSIPVGPVPISFTNFAIYITLYVLGWKRGTVSYLVYVLIGMVGMPVFSGYSGGLDVYKRQVRASSFRGVQERTFSLLFTFNSILGFTSRETTEATAFA